MWKCPSFNSRAASLSFRASKDFRQKNPKNGHNALIWYLLHAGCFTMRMPEENGTTFPIKPGQPRELITFLFRFGIPYIREAGKCTGLSKTERQISVALVRSKVIPNIPVGRNRNRCTVAWPVRWWKVFLSFSIPINQADILGRTFFPSCFLVAASEVNGSVVKAWHFHKLTAGITVRDSKTRRHVIIKLKKFVAKSWAQVITQQICSYTLFSL